MFSGTVPIYKGSVTITDIIPPSLYILYDSFHSDQDLATFIKSFTYQMYCDFINDVLSFRPRFLQSTYSSHGWSSFILDHVEELYLEES